MNYQTATKEEIYKKIETAIKTTNECLFDSPISRASQINNHIGFFQGVMAARGIDYTFDELEILLNLR